MKSNVILTMLTGNSLPCIYFLAAVSWLYVLKKINRKDMGSYSCQVSIENVSKLSKKIDIDVNFFG